ncbi:MAG: lamin tail domain-containing protein [bacterium]|nr:lamin tail domain-containing protein [bacterium]
MKKFLLSVFLLLSVQYQLKSQVANYVVLAEIYGGGGEQGSYWMNDYVLLYNPTETLVDLSTWSVQYAIFQSFDWQVVSLNGSVNAGQYYFIQFGGDGSGRTQLPFTPDVISNINLNKIKGKIALTNFQTAITTSNPIGGSGVIDFVGYGNGTNAFEGSGPAPQTSTTESIRRKDDIGNNTYGIYGNGWDSNDNLLDFRLEGNLIVNGPLPVELSSFTAKVLKKGGIELNWRTETEVSNYGFEIERSENPKSKIQNLEFKKIGFVEGHGNSNSPKDYSFTDNVISGKYSYRLKQIDTDGKFEYSKMIQVDASGMPDGIVLEQNYPNPFNPSTIIKFAVAETQTAKLIVYDVLGNEVAVPFSGTAEGGKIYDAEFSGDNLCSGIYFYRLETESKIEIRKMLLIK